jgi:hypothetical protein
MISGIYWLLYLLWSLLTAENCGDTWWQNLLARLFTLGMTVAFGFIYSVRTFSTIASIGIFTFATSGFPKQAPFGSNTIGSMIAKGGLGLTNIYLTYRVVSLYVKMMIARIKQIWQDYKKAISIGGAVVATISATLGAAYASVKKKAVGRRYNRALLLKQRAAAAEASHANFQCVIFSLFIF